MSPEEQYNEFRQQSITRAKAVQARKKKNCGGCSKSNLPKSVYTYVQSPPPPVRSKQIRRPRLLPNGALEFPKRGRSPTPEEIGNLEGYQQDPSNPNRFLPVWPECSYRKAMLFVHSDGRHEPRNTCKCEACPLFKQTVKIKDCTGCEFATPLSVPNS